MESDTEEVAFEMSIADSVDSFQSLPLLECTPLITNDITPDTSLVEENKQGEINRCDLKKVLFTVGYDQSAIKKALMNFDWKGENCYGRNRPQTHVFTQGRIFSYPKLEVVSSSNRKSDRSGGDRRISLVNEECACLVDDGLNPEVVISANDSDKDASTILKGIRIKNLKNVIVGQLNINSLRYKFHDLVELIHGNIDIMVNRNKA